jgi:hypothetical protein
VPQSHVSCDDPPLRNGAPVRLTIHNQGSAWFEGQSPVCHFRILSVVPLPAVDLNDDCVTRAEAPRSGAQRLAHRVHFGTSQRRLDRREAAGRLPGFLDAHWDLTPLPRTKPSVPPGLLRRSPTQLREPLIAILIDPHLAFSSGAAVARRAHYVPDLGLLTSGNLNHFEEHTRCDFGARWLGFLTDPSLACSHMTTAIAENFAHHASPCVSAALQASDVPLTFGPLGRRLQRLQGS